ncbi:MAG TPA: thioredoxin family protein [Xanthomonadales bacterium]|nr:thioredoxin family protein [Xanthomonadales bacterium]
MHQVVPHEQWLEARKAFLAQEKAFTRERDRLSQARRDLPWERVDKDYVFYGPAGKQTLAQLFGSSSQLVVYHFMYDPEWDEGCKSCSFWADNFNGIPVHLRARDTAFVAVSRAPLLKLDAYRKRMGWSFTWLSSSDSDFNRDFGVEFTEEEVEKKGADYNYTVQDPFDTQREGVSVFYKDESGAVYHTYSAYARGIDLLNGAYNYIDLTPKGRDEGEGNMAWLRRHDEY